MAQAHIEALQAKAQELLAMKATLEHLVHCCHGDERPECPILESLAGNEDANGSRPKGELAPSRERKRTQFQ
jgi:MerR family copper efflux transcriptional regulator